MESWRCRWRLEFVMLKGCWDCRVCYGATCWNFFFYLFKDLNWRAAAAAVWIWTCIIVWSTINYLLSIIMCSLFYMFFRKSLDVIRPWASQASEVWRWWCRQGHVRVKEGREPQGNLLMLVSIFGCSMIMADQLENRMIFTYVCRSSIPIHSLLMIFIYSRSENRHCHEW